MSEKTAIGWCDMTFNPWWGCAHVSPAQFMKIGFPKNVWLGTSVEDQKRADERIPTLLNLPAAVRFLSVEPMLGVVDLQNYLYLEWMDTLGTPDTDEEGGWGREMFAALAGHRPGIHWVIAGGESGPKARLMRPEWTWLLKEQCQAAGVAFFGKQGSGLYSERQYNLPDEVWNTKQWPESPAALIPEGRLL